MAAVRKQDLSSTSIVDFEETISEITYRPARTPEEVLSARRLQHEQYVEREFETRSFEQVLVEDQYADVSDWIIAIDPNGGGEGHIVGSVALVHHHAEVGFETLNDFPRYKRWEGPIADLVREATMRESQDVFLEVGRLAANPKYNVGKCLYRQVWQALNAQGAKAWVSNLDHRLFGQITKRYGVKAHQIGATIVDYKGSPTVPTLMYVEEQPESIFGINPEFWKLISLDRLDVSTIYESLSA